MFIFCFFPTLKLVQGRSLWFFWKISSSLSVILFTEFLFNSSLENFLTSWNYNYVKVDKYHYLKICLCLNVHCQVNSSISRQWTNQHRKPTSPKNISLLRGEPVCAWAADQAEQARVTSPPQPAPEGSLPGRTKSCLEWWEGIPVLVILSILLFIFQNEFGGFIFSVLNTTI